MRVIFDSCVIDRVTVFGISIGIGKIVFLVINFIVLKVIFFFLRFKCFIIVF